MSIGVGICTYNRPALLSLLLNGVERISSNKCNIVVAVDGYSENATTLAMLKRRRIKCVTGPLVGPTGNKNRLIKELKNDDYIFIIEDDCIIRKDGWENLFISAHANTKINHFIFCPESFYGKSNKIDKYRTFTIVHPPNDGGVFSFYTKKVFDVCGGYHPDFYGYGWGHCEFTERIWKAGLSGKYAINHIKESEDFIRINKVVPSARKAYREKEGERNMKVWKDIQKSNIIKVEI